MSPITRSWLAFAAVGTGLIHVALVLGAPWPLGLALGVVGLAEFGWGVLTFARERVVAPRVALAGALLPLLGWAALTLTAAPLAASLGFVPLGVAALLQLGAALLLAPRLRASVPPPAPSLGRYLLGLLAGLVVVGTLTAVALGATEALPGAENLPTHTPH